MEMRPTAFILIACYGVCQCYVFASVLMLAHVMVLASVMVLTNVIVMVLARVRECRLPKARRTKSCRPEGPKAGTKGHHLVVRPGGPLDFLYMIISLIDRAVVN